MFEKHSNISIYITDQKIGFFEYGQRQLKNPKYGYADLDKGVIVGGYIKEPEIFYKKLSQLLKFHKIRPNVIRYIINDQTVLKKEIIIDKLELSKQSIEDYITKQMGKTIHFPFQNPVFTHYIRQETDAYYKVLIILSDGEMLHDYHDVFDRLKAKEVVLDLPSLSLYNTYITKKKKDFNNLMLVSLYDRTITIKIVEDNVPIFSVTEEAEDSSQQYFDVLENYVERIINFYRFNINKGAKNIENIVFYNFSEDITNKILQEKIELKFKEHIYDLCEITEMDDVLKRVPKICLMGYAAGIPKNEKILMYKSLNFNLNRVPSINQALHYLMAMAFLIISSTILIYIPYYLQNEEIVNQMNINSVLQNQLEDLQRQTPVARTYTSIERNYSRAYDFLTDKETFADQQLLDLFSLLPTEITLMGYQVNQVDRSITLVITSLDEYAITDYLLYIYEYHGIVTTPTQERWMLNRPVTRLLSPIIMEVKMNYA